MQLAAFRALVRKDLVLYFPNRRALVMSILAPIREVEDEVFPDQGAEGGELHG